MSLQSIVRLAGTAAVSLLLVACAYSPAKVNLDYHAAPGTKTPLGDLKPMTYALKVDDAREPSVADRVGDKKTGYGGAGGTIKPDRDVKEIVFEAIKSELEVSGHKIVTGDVPADVTLQVAVKRYWTEGKIHFWDVEVIGALSADLTISDSHSGIPPFMRSISGTFRSSNQLVTDADYQKALNGALAEFVREMALDSQLASDLRRREPPVAN